MNTIKIHKGDTVLVITGKDRGRKGKVAKVLPGSNLLSVEGVNIKKRHTRPRKAGEKGQVVSKEAPFSLSNVKLICPKCQKATRVGYVMAGTKKVRMCKKCKAELV